MSGHQEFRVLLIAVAALAFAADRVSAGGAAFAPDVRPLFERYCFDCHGAERSKAGLDLSVFSDALAVQKEYRRWRSITDQIALRQMPPKDEEQPSDDERRRMVEWIRATLDDLDCSQLNDPGSETISRLNRHEYNYTIRDLFGAELHLTSQFPSEGDGGGGFDTNADALFVSPVLMEKYLESAERVLDMAIIVPPPMRRYEAEAEGDGEVVDGSRLIATAQPFQQAVSVPADGSYLVTVIASRRDDGGKPPMVELAIDGQSQRRFSVRSTPDRPQELAISRRLTGGVHSVTVRLVNPSPGVALLLDAVVLQGRAANPSATQRRLHDNVFVSNPGDGVSERDAAARVIARFARRAYRRPPDDDELAALMKLYDDTAKRGDGFEASVRIVLKRVLISPNFLYRFEHREPGGEPWRISDYELASRLSYLLWSSMPDDELFGLAEQKKLHDPAVLRGQVKRMLADPKAEVFAEQFAGQWLGYRAIGETITPDPDKFPEFTRGLSDAMKSESTLMFAHVVRENRSLLELIDADYTFLNQTLAEHYGVAGVEGPQMRKVALTGARRGGVLGMGGVLVATSYPLRTSPVVRGKWIMERLLGTPPPPPLPDAGLLPGESELADGLTVRQRLEQHRREPQCAACHRVMDPLGFGLENFDAIGRWREKQNGRPVDSVGELPDGRKFSGPVELKRVLFEDKQKFIGNLAEQMLTYGLGRNLEYFDRCAVKKITQAVLDDDCRAQTLVFEIVNSYPFRYQREPAAQKE